MTVKTYNKVIILTGFYAPSIGGMEKRLEKWASILLKQGLKVEVFTTALFSDKETEILDSVKVIRRDVQFEAWTDSAKMYLKENSNENTIVLISALGPGMDAGLLNCLEQAHENGSRVVMSVPTSDHIQRAISRKDGAVEFLKKVDRLITVSDDVTEFSKYSTDVVYIPNFIMDHELLNISDPYPSHNSVAFYGRIAKRKRPGLLVSVAQMLGEGMEMVVQGPAGFKEEKLYDEIVNGLKQTAVTIIGPDSRPDKKIIQSKYFINPSEVEGCSNSLLEAMNWGGIPLVSDIKENRKILGELVPLCGGSASSFVNVLYSIEESGQALSVQKAMRERIIKNYSEKAVSDSLLEALTVF